MTFLEYLICKEEQQNINEAYKSSELDKAIDTIRKLLAKETGVKIANIGYTTIRRGGEDLLSYMLCTVNDKGLFDKMLTIDFLESGKSSVPYSFAFYNKDDIDKVLWGNDKAISVKSVLSVYTLGASIVYFIPIIARVIKTNKFELTKDEVKRAAAGVFKESSSSNFFLKKSGVIFDGMLKYNVYDTIYNRINNNTIKEAYTLKLNEMKNSSELAQKRRELVNTEREAILDGDKDLVKQVRAEYKQITAAMKGGATTLEEMDMMIKRGEIATVKSPIDNMKDDVKKKVEEVQHKEPEVAFKEMRGYLNMVTSGIQPGLIICGAPGIGKTYRVTKFLKSKGYTDDVNMHIIKGKCTTRNLFLDLYKFQNKGEIILIDDADSLIGPKAPEDTINILKAALDSNDNDGQGRKISYRITGKLTDDDGMDIPKTFYYKGSVIVLTNYSVGQLDSAIKGRVFTQDLSFSSQQLLELVKQIMPAIESDKLSSTAKIKAYDFLCDLADEGTNMEISIRSFCTCARLFEMQQHSTDFSDDEIKGMIKDQVLNQAIKTGKKY